MALTNTINTYNAYVATGPVQAMTNKEFVADAYAKLLNLKGAFNNAEGRIKYWTDKLDAGTLTKANFAQAFMNEATTSQGSLVSNAEFQYNKDVVAAVEAKDATNTSIAAIEEASSKIPPVDPDYTKTFILTEVPGSAKLLEGVAINLNSFTDTSGTGILGAAVDESWIIREKAAPVLTTSNKNEGVIGDGYTGNGDDLILADAYALHGAVVNAGDGQNELRIDMKGPFAQPTLLQNIQDIKVTNLTNVYDATRADWMNLAGGVVATDSVLDLSRAIDIESLTINEGSVPGGSLTIWNVQNGADVTLQGNFTDAVHIDFAGSLDAVDLTFSNVRDSGAFALNLSHNAGQVNLTSEGRLNVLDDTNFGTDLDTLNISGSARLILNDEIHFRSDMAINVDAAGSTGGVTLNISLEDDVAVGNNTGVVNLKGGSGNDTFIIADDAAVGASDTNAITLTADMGAGNDTIAFNSANTATDLRLLNGSEIAGDNVTLHVQTNVNISAASDLFAAGTDITVALDNATIITLSADQYAEIGAENFDLASVSVGANATVSLQVSENGFDVDSVDASGLADGINLGLNVANGVTLDMTGDQFVDLVTNDVTFDGAGTINITALSQANVDALEAWADENSAALTFAQGAGNIFTSGAVTTINMTLGEDVSFTDNNGTGATVLGTVAFDLDGNTLTLTTVPQSDGLEVTNGAINLEFTGLAGTSMAMGDYTNITNITVWDALVNNNPNIENLFSNLSTSLDVPVDELLENIIKIIATPADALTPDRIVVVTEGVTRDGDLVFVTEDGVTRNDNVQNVTIKLEGGSTIDGDIILDRNTTKAGTLQTLTIESNGDTANTITGDIVGDDGATGLGGGVAQNGVAAGNIGENNLRNVTIEANQELVIEGTLVLSSTTANATATVTINGDSDVTMKAIDTTDVSVTALNIVNNLTGGATLTITGGSDALEMNNTESLTFSGSGNVVLDTDTGVGNNGIEGNILKSIDASALEGTLTIGVIEDVSSTDFEFTGAQGATTLTMAGATLNALYTRDANGNLNEAGWTFNLNAGDTLTIDESTTFTNGYLNITGGTVVFEGKVDLRSLIDTVAVPNVSALNFGNDVVIELAEDAAVLMTDLQWDSLPAAVQAALEGEGRTLDLSDAASDLYQALVSSAGDFDLTEIRGATEIIFNENFAGNLKLTAEQAAVTYTVDNNGDRSTVTVGGVNVDRADGDLREFTGTTVQVTVLNDADVSDILLNTGVFALPGDGKNAINLTITNDQASLLREDDATVGFNAANVLDQLATLKMEVEVDTGGTDVDGNAVTTMSDFTFTYSEDDDAFTVTGNAAAIATAQGAAGSVQVIALLDQAATVTWTAVGSTASMVAGLTLEATTGDDVFKFGASVDTNPATSFSITDFKDSGKDVIDFSVLSTATSTTAVSGALTTTAGAIYTFTAAGGTDVTNASSVATDVDGGATWTNADATAYIVINNAAGTAAAVWQFKDTDASAGGVEAGELTLIGTIDDGLNFATDIVTAA